MFLKQAIAQQHNAGAAAASLIASRFSDITSILRTTAAVSEAGHLIAGQRSLLLGRVLAQDRAFEACSFIDSAGRETDRVSRTTPSALLELRDLAASNAFKAPTATGSVYLGGITFDPELGIPTLEISVPYRDDLTGQIRGLLLAEVRVQWLLPELASIELSGREVTAYLLTDDGTLVAHPIPSLVARGVRFLPEKVEGFQTGIMGDRVVLASHPVGLTAQTLVLVTEASAREALAPFYRDTVVRLSGVGVALIAAIAAGILIARSVARPIAQLSRAAAALAQGDRAQRAETAGASEVRALAATFNEMAAEINRQRHERDRVNRRLELSNAELVRFASVAAHDLQEPLRKVSAFGDLLAEGAGDRLAENERDYLARMQGAARRMRDLIENLLDYSRVATGGVFFGPVELDSVVANVIEDLSRGAGSGARVETGPLPIIEADRDQMYRLFLNLVGNSLKFRHPERPPIVRITGRIEEAPPGDPQGMWCEVLVRDNGIGFEPEYAESIFGIFQRLHGRSEYEGTGIGLAICRRIVDRHGGTITAEGKPGQGATIEVRLPVHQSQEEA